MGTRLYVVNYNGNVAVVNAVDRIQALRYAEAADSRFEGADIENTLRASQLPKGVISMNLTTTVIAAEPEVSMPDDIDEAMEEFVNGFDEPMNAKEVE